ncbi:MAG: zinc-binding dehydrogenase [Acidimicrobiia bacterium]|nr:zinc-binding dehydrogenase [Acidimicrobiia bacterium]
MPTTTVRAAVSRAFRAPVAIEEVELSSPLRDEVRVRLGAVAICHSDIAYLDDYWGGDLPAVWGHEASGTVTEIGAAVSTAVPGDRVVVSLVRSCGTCHRCAQGRSVACTGSFERGSDSPLRAADGAPITHGLRTAAFAEEVVVHASQVVRIPDDLAFGPAALLSCGVVTGFGAVANTAGVEPGSSVVVIGTGGVGLHSVQGARLAGASTIIAVDVSGSKLDWARRLGATLVASPLDADVPAFVADATGGAMADYVFVTTGAPPALQSSHELVASTGALVLVGMPATGVTMNLDVGTFAALNQRVLGSRMGTTTLARDVPKLVALYQRGDLELDALISGTYPFSAINDGIDDAREGRSIRNVITFEQAS